jgi:hypothetical protein
VCILLSHGTQKNPFEKPLARALRLTSLCTTISVGEIRILLFCF